MSGETDLAKLLSSMKPSLSHESYVFVSVKGKISELAFLDPWAVIAEEEGMTAIIAKETADAASVPYEAIFRRVTLTVHSSLEAIGLTAAVSAKLTAYGISANVVAAFYHDHIFVPKDKAELAMEALEQLVQENTLFE